jgi:type IV secretion system protein VirD4
MPSGIVTLIIVTGSMLALFVIITTVGNNYSLNQIKNKTVGQGQHGTARWATKKEIKRTYMQIDFQPNEWRNNPESRPTEQGIVVGCRNSRKGTTALVDTGDVYALMIGAAGVGKTAYWLYPCIIAGDIKLSPATVRRAIKDLKNTGLLETQQRYREQGGKSSLLFKIKML